MGEQGTTQPRSSPPAQGGGGKRASVARTVEAATPIRQAISRVGMPPTNFTKHFAHMAHCGPLCWHQVPLWTAKGTGLCRLRHGAPPTAPALDRAAIDANDRGEPSSRSDIAISTTIAARQTRRPRKRSGARVSRIPVVEDTFRQRSPNFKPLQRYNRCATRVTPTFSERYMVPV